MKQINRAGNFFLVFLMICSLPIFTAAAQTDSYQVSIDSLAYNKFPQLDTYLSVLDVQGFPITGLGESNFIVMEDGLAVDDFSVSQYTNTDETLAIVLVIDTSGSMDSSKEPSPLDNAIEAAKDFVSKLSDQDLVAVVAFSDEVNVLSTLSSDKSSIPSLLDSLDADGATAMNDAVVESINILKNSAERRAIILITDGKPEGDQVYTFDQAFAHASNYKIPIYPIGFGAVDENQLKRLADATGGSEQVKPDSLALGSAFDSILGIFRQQYYLKFDSALSPDNQQHELVVSVNYQGATQTAKDKFIARKPVMVSIDSPASEETLNGEVQVMASVDSLNTCTGVNFYVDDDLVQNSTQAPYVYSWDTTASVTGNHTLKVKAVDEYGFSDEAVLDVVVELQRQDWLYWLIGLVVLIAAALFISLGLRRRKIPPKAVQKAVLIEVEGHQPGAEWALDREEINLGRLAAENDIHLKGKQASRKHAKIEKTAKGYVITTRKRENPLIVNGQSTLQATLKENDTIKLGESVFRFEYKG